jgi:NADH:ubiquinone oxidoreductase subunit 3 (subunit A)
LIIIALPKLLAKEVPQKDKLKSYECGFDARLMMRVVNLM